MKDHDGQAIESVKFPPCEVSAFCIPPNYSAQPSLTSTHVKYEISKSILSSGIFFTLLSLLERSHRAIQEVFAISKMADKSDT